MVKLNGVMCVFFFFLKSRQKGVGGGGGTPDKHFWLSQEPGLDQQSNESGFISGPLPQALAEALARHKTEGTPAQAPPPDGRVFLFFVRSS